MLYCYLSIKISQPRLPTAHKTGTGGQHDWIRSAPQFIGGSWGLKVTVTVYEEGQQN